MCVSEICAMIIVWTLADPWQAGVVFLQDCHYLRATEFGRNVRVTRAHFALLRTGDRNVILGIMWTRLRRRHSVALPAVKGDVDLQRLGQKGAGPQLIEDMMRVKGGVVAADSGMIAPHDQMRAAEVLTN